ncbi:aldo/keto reductase [Merismopedia glauca]|uniref:Aldo/keto reductase n=1 Tax=Merismopedia glauca CCAP 1448/3 TaxID=1296344 RepID=A0A2T1BX60_9CYAN|nr:aldo/keto reductase [Merismopedia glauca]PSB00599.1 aldo/keto reductase [Merismopedia glauca CCAP 1448/3]
MEKRVLGTSGIEISPIVMGTWQAGKRGWVGIEDSEIIKALQAAFTAGITTFDTAEIYGDGYSEKLVGEALAGIREQVVLATKVFANHLKYEQVIAACDRSLLNLQTDYIDLYQIHWPAGAFGNEIVPIGETMRALNDLKTQGKIRAIGVSNFSGQQLEAASQFGRIDSLQPPYSLFWRYVETDAMPYCLAHQISILAYSPMAQGLLTGKFGPDQKFPPTDNRSQNKLFQGENYQRAQLAVEQLRPLAAELKCTLGQLALAWVITQPQAIAIAGARNTEQVLANAQAVEIKLSSSQLQQIDAIARQVTDYLDNEPVMWNWKS